MEVDFTDQIKQMKADEKAGYPPNCNEGYEEKDGKCVVIEGYWKKKNMAKHYPGENVKRNKDGSPTKKIKKRATKSGEYRDKAGNLKKAKAEEGEVDLSNYMPKTKGLENPRNQHEYDGDKNLEVNEPIDLSDKMPKTKGLENPRNMNEYYKYLYKKVKGLD